MEVDQTWMTITPYKNNVDHIIMVSNKILWPSNSVALITMILHKILWPSKLVHLANSHDFGITLINLVGTRV